MQNHGDDTRTGGDDAWSWVRAAAAGDTAAFGRLYAQHHREIYRFVRRRTTSAELAEDLTQDTFLRALRAIGTVTDQGRPVAAWLVTIARNLILDHAKSSRTRREVLTSETIEDRAWLCSAEDCVIAEFDRRDVLAAIRHLTPVQRECIALRFLAGCTLEETADYTGSNVGSVKAAQRRGLRSLRLLLSSNCRTVDPAKPVQGCALTEAAA